MELNTSFKELKSNKRHCCVPQCRSNGQTDSTVHFHNVTSSTRKSIWLQKIRRDGDEGKLFKVTKATVVCSKHFKPDDYRPSLTGRSLLQSTAVPSVFPWTTTNTPRRGKATKRRFHDTTITSDADTADEDTCLPNKPSICAQRLRTKTMGVTFVEIHHSCDSCLVLRNWLQDHLQFICNTDISLCVGMFVPDSKITDDLFGEHSNIKKEHTNHPIYSANLSKEKPQDADIRESAEDVKCVAPLRSIEEMHEDSYLDDADFESNQDSELFRDISDNMNNTTQSRDIDNTVNGDTTELSDTSIGSDNTVNTGVNLRCKRQKKSNCDTQRFKSTKPPSESRNRKTFVRKKGTPYKHESSSSSITELTFDCRFCSKSFPTKQEFSKHEWGMHRDGRKFICTFCPFTTSKSTLLIPHIQSHDIVPRFCCEVCGEQFRVEKYMKRHVLAHEIPRERLYECTECDRKFFCKHTLTNHIKVVHAKFKKFLCQECGFRSKCAYGLRIHVASSHSDGKNAKCDYCDYATKLSSNLTLHIKNKHPNEFNQLPTQYNCPHCSYSSHVKFGLSAHLKYHTNPTLTNTDTSVTSQATSND